jgi:hypothetical protein
MKSLEAANLVSIIFIARSTRLLIYLTEIQTFATIGATLNQFSTSFGSLLFTLYSVFLVFAVIGGALWSGKVTDQSVVEFNASVPTLYYLLNFNDFGASLVTLFH